eukprot:TRINITY_DN1893_c1_g2_i1.p1 TRINITY_DN1893_c1_g2~~TRINITY_DN1893_c1_g2_i1.p1  ORF type:complete len:164 (-),score=49.59 TRINITY_DN1893_c1_g2_i1:131-622(-)
MKLKMDTNAVTNANNTNANNTNNSTSCEKISFQIFFCATAIILATLFILSSTIGHSLDYDDDDAARVLRDQGLIPDPKIRWAASCPDNFKYTRPQVYEHRTKNDLWLIIGAHVYNLTSFVNKHPGGLEILRGVGQDATTLFESFHSPYVGVEHLPKYCIGSVI